MLDKFVFIFWTLFKYLFGKMMDNWTTLDFK